MDKKNKLNSRKNKIKTTDFNNNDEKKLILLLGIGIGAGIVFYSLINEQM